MSANNTVLLKVSFLSDDKSRIVHADDVKRAISAIQTQLASGATAGQIKNNNNDAHQGDSDRYVIKVKWSLEGDVDF